MLSAEVVNDNDLVGVWLCGRKDWPWKVLLLGAAFDSLLVLLALCLICLAIMAERFASVMVLSNIWFSFSYHRTTAP